MRYSNIEPYAHASIIRPGDESWEHVTSGEECWCGAKPICAECGTEAACVHGSERALVYVHKDES